MFNPELFAARRKRLMEMMLPNSVALIPTAPVAVYSRDTEYPFRADSDFYYLTGFKEPEAAAIISTVEGKPAFTLFVRPRDPAKEIWTGKRAGIEGAREIYRADEAYEISELTARLPLCLENLTAIYHFPGKYPDWDEKLFKAWQEVRMKWRQGIDAPFELIDLGHLMSEMRLFKTVDDLNIQKEACRITCEAHELAMRSIKPGMNEREIEALINHYFRASGAFGPGFPTIVASGPNSCCLHYIQNDRDILEGDLVLVDAGAEYEFYNGDVTRTYPCGGRFTPEQKAVYETVLAAQTKAIELCVTGKTPNDMHDEAVRVLVDGMIHLGLLKGTVDEAIETESYKKYYMHKTGHWLGVDVHDVGAYRKDGKWRTFEPGMVTTVEPGIYIPEDDCDVPEGFRGTGIRIEDNIHITAEGPENLTASCPKAIDELEELINQS